MRGMNRLGVAASYTHSWDYLKSVANTAVAPAKAQLTPRILTYDNLNMTKGIHHERSGTQMCFNFTH